MIARILLLIAGSIAVAGCTTVHKGGDIKALICTPGVCKVTVTVRDCFAWDGISVDHERVVVRNRQHIQWEIATTDYTFTDDGVKIDWNPGNEFDDPRPAGKNFQWHDNYTIKDRFKYTINVRNKNGVRCRPYDPWIDNQ